MIARSSVCDEFRIVIATQNLVGAPARFEAQLRPAPLTGRGQSGGRDGGRDTVLVLLAMRNMNTVTPSVLLVHCSSDT
jgi:hypothetical protein